jgi:putative ABC transport system substrate-binding protein
VLDIRYSEGNVERYPQLVAEVVAAEPDLIVIGSYPGVLAAKRATNRIPIAGFSCGLDLLVDSLARPGANVTGVTCQSTDLVAKQLELLRETLPKAARIAVLVNPSSPYAAPAVQELKRAGSRLDLGMIEIAVRSQSDFEAAMREARQASCDAVFITPDAMLFSNRVQLVTTAIAHRLPAMGFFPEFARAGALLSYSSNRELQYRRLAQYADRILKGAKPADLPVEQPTRFELVVNLATANALGIAIPPSVLQRADEVIR